jgi:phosphoglycerol transferase MdoB-like AlkP superfamily enzyme
MENPLSLIETLFEKTEHYAKTSAELIKLKAIDKSADVISTLTARLTVVVFIALFFLVLNIGIALWIGEMLGKSYYGFFIVAGFYALVGIVLYAFRDKWIKAPLKNSIITQALN